MVIASTATSQQPSQDSRFKTAGWFSILGAILFFPGFIIEIFPNFHTIFKLSLFPYITLIIIAAPVLLVYVFTQFKRLLNERFNIHNLNAIITALIISNIVVGVKHILISQSLITPLIRPFTLLGMSSFLLLGVIGIILGVRLLSIHDQSSGLLQAYAIISIIASSCFLSIILFSFGMLLLFLLFL